MIFGICFQGFITVNKLPSGSKPEASWLASVSAVSAVIGIVVPLVFSILALVCGLIALVRIRNSKGRIGGEGRASFGASLGGVFTLLWAILIPVVILPALAAARGLETMSNLKLIGSALYEFQSRNGRFPSAYIVDGNGKPMLSWRVSLLPYLDQESLYREFDLAQPWDSERNRPLIAKIPRIYQSPFLWSNAKGATHVVAVVGPNAAWTESAPVNLDELVDGPHNTLWVVEYARDDIPWTQPADLKSNEMSFTINDSTKPSIGSASRNGASIVLVDGSVLSLPNDFSSELLKALINRRDGKPDGQWAPGR